MTGSNSRILKNSIGLTAALTVVGTLAALTCTPVAAQDAKPGPVSILPAAAPPEGEPAPQEPAIDVGDLAAPGVDRIGLVDPSVGGFTAQLWRGTDFELLKKILPQLPRRIASPAERRLAQNLLLSPGSPPPSLTSATGDTSLSASQWLLEMRAATLAALGSWNDVAALLDLVPADQMTDSLKHLKAEAALVTNHVNNACNQAQTALTASPDPYWQKLQVFCQINMDQSSAAGLGLSLLHEQKVDDPAFFWAADVLGGGTPPLPANVTKLEPLHFAMLRKAGATLPANIADVQAKITDPSTLAWLAVLPSSEPAAGAAKTPAKVLTDRRRAQEEARILLAERAVAAGTLDADALRGIYRNINIKDPAPPPLTQIKADDARGRALLFQSAALQTVPTARAEVIAMALDLVRADRGEKGPDLMVMGRVYAPLIAEMEPAADHVWFAGTAVRALMAAAATEKGPAARAATDKARAWFDLARGMGRTSREAGQIADALWPMEKIMTGAGNLTPEAVHAWSTAQPSTLSPAVVAERRAIMLSLLTGLGEQVSAAEWLPLMGGPAKQDNVRPLAPYIWNGLDLAAREKRTGETAALALIALSEDGPGKAAAPSLQQVIGALRAVGREADARALAVEAALVLGL